MYHVKPKPYEVFKYRVLKTTEIAIFKTKKITVIIYVICTVEKN